MKSFFALALLFVSGLASADTFCSKNNRDILESLNQQENRLAFLNDGGLGDGGVCWWHSRFTRSAAYLAKFLPEKPKPSLKKIKLLIRRLTHMDQVVEIPGYANLASFSYENEDLIQKELNNWQLVDGFAKQVWVISLMGKTHQIARKVEERFETIVKRVNDKLEPLFLKVQYPGVTAHALIVLKAEKKSDAKGAFYELSVIDSNNYKLMPVIYRVGEDVINYKGENIMMYLNFNNEISWMRAARREYCQK